jgi:hypothetical protein
MYEISSLENSALDPEERPSSEHLAYPLRPSDASHLITDRLGSPRFPNGRERTGLSLILPLGLSLRTAIGSQVRSSLTREDRPVPGLPPMGRSRKAASWIAGTKPIFRGTRFATIIMCTVMLLSTGLSLHAQTATSAPRAEISNGKVRANIYLPDPKDGFYRGTRFDWSGVVTDLKYGKHTYFGQWFSRTDPSVHDFIYDGSDIVAGPCSAITGPVEEFAGPLGYEDAKPGGSFVKIGVGVLQKPDDKKYDAFRLYPIVDSGKWTIHKGPRSVEFTQEIHDPSSGYAYLYRKVVRLAGNTPGMVIEHSLTNLGTHPIQTRVYDHNFFVLDQQPPGPAFTITLPFEIAAQSRSTPGLVDFRGKQILFLKTLTEKDHVYALIRGFGNTPEDYHIRIENSQVNAGMTISGDRPLANLALWSIRSVVATEPFIDLSIEPGSQLTWKYEYQFYSLEHSSK